MLHKGAIAKKFTVDTVRELTREELGLLAEPRQRQPGVARFRDPHHRLARLISSGLRYDDVAAKSGYSKGRVLTLMQDPAFLELVASYRDQVTGQFLEAVDDYYEMATGNMLKAERQIAEKLEIAEENGETLPTRDLLAISRDAADRFGYGKKQTNVNVNIDFAAQLEKAIKRSGKIIEGKESPRLGVTPGAPPEQSGDSQPIRRRA